MCAWAHRVGATAAMFVLSNRRSVHRVFACTVSTAVETPQTIKDCWPCPFHASHRQIDKICRRGSSISRVSSLSDERTGHNAEVVGIFNRFLVSSREIRYDLSISAL